MLNRIEKTLILSKAHDHNLNRIDLVSLNCHEIETRKAFISSMVSSGLRNVQSVQMHRGPPLLGAPPFDLSRAEKF